MLSSRLNINNQKTEKRITKSFIKCFGSTSKNFEYGHSKIFNLISKLEINFPLLENLYVKHKETLGEDEKEIFKGIFATQIYYTFILRNIVTLIAQKHVIQNITNLFDEISSFDGIIDNFVSKNRFWMNSFRKTANEFGTNSYFLQEIKNTDIFQAFYLDLFPRNVRKILGEVYTPYWLAKLMVDNSSWIEKNFNSSVLDPSCGSGSFIKAFISKALKNNKLTPQEKFEFIINNINGFDINPIAVFTSKLNFLIHIADIIPKNYKFAIPISIKDVFSDFNVKKRKFDYIIGNPPWINWEHLANTEKIDLTEFLHYKIGPSKQNLNKTLGYAKQDISGIFLIYLLENYSKEDGRICFLLSKALINGKANSSFRKYFFNKRKLKNGSNFARIIKIEDLTLIQPFQNVKTATIILHVQKRTITGNEIPFLIWKLNSETNSKSVDNVENNNVLIEHKTAKFIEFDEQSNIVVPEFAKSLKLKIKDRTGNFLYSAKEGANTEGLNSAFWIENIKTNTKNLIDFNNYTKNQKNKIQLTKNKSIEIDLVYPLVRSGNIKKWNYSINTYIIFTAKYFKPEIRNESKFMELYPFTYNYFNLIRDKLKNRKSYIGKSKNLPFYIIYGHTDMTTGYKVCWKRIGTSIEAVVLGHLNDPLFGNKCPVPQETLVYINTGDNYLEAHYLCAILNSELFNSYVNVLKTPGSKSFGTPDILNYIYIPKFDSKDSLHREVAKLSIEIHITTNKKQGIIVNESRINKIVEKIL